MANKSRERRVIYAQMRELEAGQFLVVNVPTMRDCAPFRQMASYLKKVFDVAFSCKYDFTSGKLTITRTK